MTKWLCKLGLHREKRMHAPGGGSYGHCVRCGRDRDIGLKIIA
jgi:hypothetical protein